MSPNPTAGEYEGWRRNFYTLWVAELAAIIGFQAVQPFLPLYIQEFAIGGPAEALIWAGRMGTAAGLAMAISSPLWGSLADRYGRKPMVVRSMIGGGISVIVMAYVTTVEQLLVARLLQGTLAGTVTACLTLVSTSTPRRHLGFALGLMQGAFMLGASVGPLIGGPLIEAFGYQECFLWAGVTVVFAGCTVHLLVHEDFTRARRVESSTKYSMPGRDMWRLLAVRPFLVLVLTVTAMAFAFGFVMPVVPLFLQELAGRNNVVTLAGVVFAASGLVGAVSAALMGRYSDQIGPRRVLVGGLLAAAAFHLAQGYSTSVVIFAVLAILGGLATGATRPVANSLITRIVVEKDRGKAFGVMTSASALGWAMGPMAGGHIGAHYGFRAVFTVTAIVFLAVGAWAWISMQGVDDPETQESLE